ncbi:hypothetical protein L917_05405 [Phytophthora nicotianae]|uniref:Uncharacterized protein n=1 Tax=Phytophthora nicotianae TaxID=4792 RepID=W2LKW8_PHYNI|nr:hypothetical protein L915_05579 [Phytophthora nicotianae]ETL97270.1 hypothetical protein L917_05405 [Phytophthora nicotianae]ETM50420.1 hypothetical protein L914_05527 [Phytophthora nicotianae]
MEMLGPPAHPSYQMYRERYEKGDSLDVVLANMAVPPKHRQADRQLRREFLESCHNQCRKALTLKCVVAVPLQAKVS